jgi:hypothetical protein
MRAIFLNLMSMHHRKAPAAYARAHGRTLRRAHVVAAGPRRTPRSPHASDRATASPLSIRRNDRGTLACLGQAR